MRLSNGGVWVGQRVYSMVWATRGKVPLWLIDANVKIPLLLEKLLRAKVSPTAGKVRGYPYYDSAQNVTLWQFRIPIHDTVNSPRIEEIYWEGERLISSWGWGLLKTVDSYYIQSQGQTLNFPVAFFQGMGEGVKDPLGFVIEGGSFREEVGRIFTPARTVLTWGLAGVVGFGLYRVFQFVDKTTKGGVGR